MRRYYICPVIGSGKDEMDGLPYDDSFRPLVANYTTDRGRIDLKEIGLGCLAYADTPTPIVDPNIKFQIDDLTKRIDNKKLYNFTGVWLEESYLPDWIAMLLTVKAKQLGLNPLKPMHDGKLRVHLGGLIWGEPELRLRVGTFTDNFNRTEELGASANWTELEGDWECVSNTHASARATNSISLARCVNAELSSLNHYSELSVITLNYPTGGASLIGTCIRFYNATTGWADAKCYYTSARADQSAGDTYFRIKLRNNGASSELATKSYSYSLPDTTKGEIDGSAFKGYVNSVEEHSVTDSTLPPGGATASDYYFGGLLVWIDNRGSAGDMEGDDYAMANLVAAGVVGDYYYKMLMQGSGY